MDLSGSPVKSTSWRSVQTGFEAVSLSSRLSGSSVLNPLQSYTSLTLCNRSNIGNIVCNVMMQQLNKKHPDDYTLPLRILWAPIGLMILCWIFIPESPWYYTRRGNKDQAMKSLKQLYSNVEGYDYEEEYNIIARTIQHEKDALLESPNFTHLFKGTNLV